MGGGIGWGWIRNIWELVYPARHHILVSVSTPELYAWQFLLMEECLPLIQLHMTQISLAIGLKDVSFSLVFSHMSLMFLLRFQKEMHLVNAGYQ